MIVIAFELSFSPSSFDLAAAEVLARPLDNVRAAQAAGEAAGTGATPARGGETEEVGLDQPAASVAPVPTTTLVVVVEGTWEGFSAQLDGLDILAEASCQVRPLSFEWCCIDSSPRGWVRCPLWTRARALLFVPDACFV